MVNNSEIAKRDIPDKEFTESCWLTDKSKNSSRLWLKSFVTQMQMEGHLYSDVIGQLLPRSGD